MTSPDRHDHRTDRAGAIHTINIARRITGRIRSSLMTARALPSCNPFAVMRALVPRAGTFMRGQSDSSARYELV
jgi:hypothetical protein